MKLVSGLPYTQYRARPRDYYNITSTRHTHFSNLNTKIFYATQRHSFKSFKIVFCVILYTVPLVIIYEGRPINKLQNGIILLIFKIWKIRNIAFVRSLILNNNCEFFYDDVTVTSFVNDKYTDATAETIP